MCSSRQHTVVMSVTSFSRTARCLRRAGTSVTVYLVLLCLLCTAFSAADPKYTVGDAMPGVIQLTEQNITKYIGGRKSLFLEFYAPWCHFSQLAADEVAALGATLLNSSSDSGHLVIAKMDAMENEKVAQHFNVTGFPTFLYFPANSRQPRRYSASNSRDDFANFLQRMMPNLEMRSSREPSLLTDIYGNFDDVASDTARHRLVLFYAPWCDYCKQIMPELNKLAALYARDGAEVAFTRVDATDETNTQIAKQMKVNGFPTLAYIPKGYGVEKSSQYSGERSLVAMLNFLHKKTGVLRLLDGDYSWSHGVQRGLARQVKSITQKSKEHATAALATLRDKMSAESQKSASVLYYLDVAQHVIESGDTNFVASEHDRLQEQLRIMPQGAARDEAVVKVNVLRSLH